MSLSPLPLDLLSSDFVLCAFDIRHSPTGYEIGMCVIDSYAKIIKICQLSDTSYFTLLESIIQQNVPQHEFIKFCLLVNCPNQSVCSKIKEKAESLGSFDQIVVDINLPKFKEKHGENVFTSTWTLFDEEEFNKYKIQFNYPEFVFPLEVLEHTTMFTNLLSIDELNKVFKLEKFNHSNYMSLDSSCVKCLNLFDDDNSRGKYLDNIAKKLSKNYTGCNTKTSLYSVLNNCCTKFGSRILKTWILQPLQDIDRINERLNIVEIFIKNVSFNQELRSNYLSKIDDIQTINIKLSNFISLNMQKESTKNLGNDIKNNSGNSSWKYNIKNKGKLITLEDCAKLQRCIDVCKNLYGFLKLYTGIHSELFVEKFVRPLAEYLKYLGKLEELISKAIAFDHDEKEYKINPQISEKLKEIQSLIEEDYSQIKRIRDEVEKGINNKKRVKIQEYLNSGFCFELTKKEAEEFLKSHDDFRMVVSNKKTIIFSNPELRKFSASIKDNKKLYSEKEKAYIVKILSTISTYHPIVDKVVPLLAALDILSSFAVFVSDSKFEFCKPEIRERGSGIKLTSSRHILLEYLVPSSSADSPVVPNDLEMTPNVDNVHILTGINMGGKSTYLRQVGVCVLMAHIGSYVPAVYASIPIIDQILTRVGAGDLMLKGVSTYMNEMIEICSMIKAATSNSLLLIDELGRGTSTEDGVAVSAAIIDHISKNLQCFCLFSTHFFELTKLEEILPNVKNYYVNHTIEDKEIKMKYKVLRGKTETSLGIGLFTALHFDKYVIDTLEKYSKEQ